MNNIFVEFLPPWVETGLQPAFYDKESGTVLQQTARMYARVNMLIRMFNKLSKQTKEEIERFETETTEEIERFKESVNYTVEEYINKFNELHDYVMDYFDNLDVQQEINNKLDELLEDGILQEIIATYIQSNVAWTFDTVAEMKLATNLINGSYAMTLGFHSINDGGGALYKISNSGTANEMDVIAIDSLFAHLIIEGKANVKQFGAYGDNTNDDQTVIQYVLDNFNSVYLPDAQYLTNSSLQIKKSNQTIICEGEINYQGNESALHFDRGSNNNITIRNIRSNGVGVLVEPSANCGGTTLYVRMIYSELECYKVNGDRSSSSWYISGLRWQSLNNSVIRFNIPSGSSGTYFNRFIFQNMSIVSNPQGGEKGIIFSNNGDNTCDIQIELVRLNLEGSKGIKTNGHVAVLNIEQCRLSEIAGTNWLEINDYIPYCTISTPTRLDLSKIVFNNITAGERVKFLCGVIQNGFEYINGVIYRSDDNKILFTSADNFHKWYTASSDTNVIGDDITSSSAPYIIPYQITVSNTNANTEVTIPNFIYNFVKELLFNVTTNTTVTVKYGTRTITSNLGRGVYKFYNFSDRAYYIQLT